MTDARGHYTIGKELVDDVIDRIRRVAGKILQTMDCQIRTELISIRQLFLSAGFPDLPLFRWWYWLWFRCAAARASFH